MLRPVRFRRFTELSEISSSEKEATTKQNSTWTTKADHTHRSLVFRCLENSQKILPPVHGIKSLIARIMIIQNFLKFQYALN